MDPRVIVGTQKLATQHFAEGAAYADLHEDVGSIHVQCQ